MSSLHSTILTQGSKKCLTDLDVNFQNFQLCTDGHPDSVDLST